MTTAKERAQLAELEEIDRSNRVGRTVVQVGASAAGFTLVEYVLAFFGVDLDPIAEGVQHQIPNGVKEALIVLGAWGIARYMNRPIKEPVGDGEAGAVELGYVLVAVIFFVLGLLCAANGILVDRAG